MKKYIKIILTTLLFITSFNAVKSQNNAATTYFMDDISSRYDLNPALAPQCKFYFDFVVLPNFYFEGGTNNFILRDLIYNQNSKTTTFLSSKENIENFYKNLRPSSYINADLSLNILSLGFRIKRKHFFMIDLGLQAEAAAALPKDLFKFGLYGTPKENEINTFNLNSLGMDFSLYSNVGIGYTYIAKNWTAGIRANFLMGYANVYTNVNKLKLNASRQKWELETNAEINASLPITYRMTEDGNIDFTTMNLSSTDDLLSLLYNPAGYGATFDLGGTYSPIKGLTLSAAVTNLGFIRWKRNVINGQIQGQHIIDDIIEYNVGDSLNEENLLNNITGLGEEILETIDTGKKTNYNSLMKGNFNVAVEYGVLNNKISFGLLNQMKFYNKHVEDEVTLAVNFRPAAWFKTSISYSFVNGRWGNLGLGLNLNAGFLNMFIVADYIPVSWAKMNINGSEIPAPYRTQYVNLQAGLSFNIGRDALDLDKDGVNWFRDRCPETNMDFLRKQCPGLKKRQYVDRHGCELDSDRDGVHDCYDKCPNTPEGVQVDSLGCPVDNDFDGVPDYLDRCPETPENVQVDSLGCPIDNDNDGVPDYLDKCLNTPIGAPVDSEGCPLDTDKDGVADYLDKCPNTPLNVHVDSVGCPLDTDKDGVPDYLDKCPNTPNNILVDASGCPIDTDRDGVPDYLDQCPGTPSGTIVNEVGCPADSDGDGVLDMDDKCPNNPGPASNHGCPEIKKEVRNLFKKALNGIQFESGKAIIKKSSYTILNQIVSVMELNSEYNLIIKGHTDSSGDDAKNLQLSENRANAVKDYLVNKGIDTNRLKAEGYGETMPIATNNTKKGRALNRRVELEIQFETITYEKVTNPELGQTEDIKNDSIINSKKTN